MPSPRRRWKIGEGHALRFRAGSAGKTLYCTSPALLTIFCREGKGQKVAARAISPTHPEMKQPKPSILRCPGTRSSFNSKMERGGRFSAALNVLKPFTHPCHLQRGLSHRSAAQAPTGQRCPFHRPRKGFQVPLTLAEGVHSRSQISTRPHPSAQAVQAVQAGRHGAHLMSNAGPRFVRSQSSKHRVVPRGMSCRTVVLAQPPPFASHAFSFSSPAPNPSSILHWHPTGAVPMSPVLEWRLCLLFTF
mmetsp:Transcript_109427/g.185864  ORF Transcript_109427/g.185864 Transcript_109427/m.185864 type:complete len:247 (+) Transcript_109427:919-1659(+)